MLRDQNSTGYYRVTGDVSASFSSGIAQATARGYRCKVIDGSGYSMSVSTNPMASLAAAMAGIMLKNAVLSLTSYSSASSATIVPLVNCYFTDCYLRTVIAYFAAATYFADRGSCKTPQLE